MKILIVDDHAVVRQGYASLLSTMLSPCEVKEAGNGDQAYSMCQEETPDMYTARVVRNSTFGCSRLPMPEPKMTGCQERRHHPGGGLRRHPGTKHR